MKAIISDKLNTNCKGMHQLNDSTASMMNVWEKQRNPKTNEWFMEIFLINIRMLYMIY